MLANQSTENGMGISISIQSILSKIITVAIGATTQLLGAKGTNQRVPATTITGRRSPGTMGTRPCFPEPRPRTPPNLRVGVTEPSLPRTPPSIKLVGRAPATGVPPWAKTPKPSQAKTRTAAGEAAKGDRGVPQTPVPLRPALHGEGAERAPPRAAVAPLRALPATAAADLVDGTGVAGLLEVEVILLPADGRATRAEVPETKAVQGQAPLGPSQGTVQAPTAADAGPPVLSPQLFGGYQAATRCRRGSSTWHVDHLDGALPEAMVAADRVATGPTLLPLLPCAAQVGAAGAAAHPLGDQAGARRPPLDGTDLRRWARRF